MRLKISLGIKYPSCDHGAEVYSINVKLKSNQRSAQIFTDRGVALAPLSHRGGCISALFKKQHRIRKNS